MASAETPNKALRDGDIPVKVLETERLILRQLAPNDAEFILELLNEPSFIRNVGDKGVRAAADACTYILSGPVASYEQFGFGLYLVELKESSTPVGICGLVKRAALADVDLGFAFLPKFWSKGYAVESALAVKTYARQVIELKRIVAVTVPDNQSSIRVLEKIGFRFERTVSLSDDGQELKLFACDV